jgi:hypothetical protein
MKKQLRMAMLAMLVMTTAAVQAQARTRPRRRQGEEEDCEGAVVESEDHGGDCAAAGEGSGAAG